MKNCPTCSRPFNSILDYPLIVLDEVEILTEIAPPDHESLKVPWSSKEKPNGVWKQLSQLPEIQKYLDALLAFTKQEIEPNKLLPPWEANGYFKWAYPVAKLIDDYMCDVWEPRRYIALQDNKNKEGTCRLVLYEDGPNFGSAGGPTLSTIGIIARINYTGILN